MLQHILKKRWITGLLAVWCMTSLMAGEGKVPPQTLYYGGDIITIKGENPTYVEALMLKEGKVIYLGKKDEAVNNYAGKTVKIDLKGKTLMPSSFDVQGHLLLETFLIDHDDLHTDNEKTASIEKGKQADMVMLSANPFKVNKEKIKKIRVLEIFNDGKSIFKRAPLVGADKDAHGCIASAGYRWCAKTQQCERPWELAKKEKFEKSAEAFKSFCGNK